MKLNHILLSLALLTSAAFAAETKDITIDVAGKPALKASVPKEATVTAKGEETTVQTKGLIIYVWHVPGVKSVDDALPKVNEVIKHEFVKYAVSSTESMKVAGHEAKHLEGKGEEGDDNDPGTADVVVFTDGKNVFVACVHGEKDEAAKERPGLLKVLESIKGE
jgi:hypothetical protein